MSGPLLAMDAATGVGTLAVLVDGALAAERSVAMAGDEDDRFLPAVAEVLAEADVAVHRLRGLVVGAGPGSFTALRVVAATAKGIAQARALPLLPVPSLALTVAADARTAGTAGRWFSTLDALRGERYAALVMTDARGTVRSVEPLGLCSEAEVASRAAALGAIPIGPGESHAGVPHARGVLRCLELIAAIGSVDLAAWAPSYGRLAEAQVKWEAAHGRPLG